ncbi:hypothetical protein ABZY05_39650 [Streptomyces canus]
MEAFGVLGSESFAQAGVGIGGEAGDGQGHGSAEGGDQAQRKRR